MSKFLDGEIGRRMSDAEIRDIELDMKKLAIPDEDKAPFLNLIFWAVAGLNADELMAVYDRDKDALKAEIENLKQSYFKACQLAEENRAKLEATPTFTSSALELAKAVEKFKGAVIVAELDAGKYLNIDNDFLEIADALSSFRACALPTTPEKWADISTAPRDGTRVIISGLMAGGGRYVDAAEFQSHGYEDGWAESKEAASEGEWFMQPDLWQPLPPPPSPKGGEG